MTVLVNGRPVQALVDSGAQSSVVDRGLAARLGLATTVLAPVIIAFGVSGAPRLGRTARLEAVLGGLTLRGLRPALFELAQIAAASGRPFDLILGQDVLRRLVAEFDFPGARLAFHAPAGFAPPPDARPVRVRSDGRALFAPITVEGAALEGVIDTGATSALALSAETASAAGLLADRPVDWAPAITFGGAARDRLIHVDNVGFAGQIFRNLPVHVYTPSGVVPLPSGLIGIEAFDRFRVFMDLGRGRLHLVPRPATPASLEPMFMERPANGQ